MGRAWRCVVVLAMVAACGPSGLADDDGTDGSVSGDIDARPPPAVRTWVDPSLPQDISDGFDALNVSGSLDLVYPNPNAIIPRDLAAIDVQGVASSGLNVYRVSFEVATGDVLRGYVTDASWLPNDSDWTWLMGRAAGQSVTLTLAGASYDANSSSFAGDAQASAPQQLFVSSDEATGAMFYFATTGDQLSGDGILERLEVGARQPDPYLDRANSGGNCVGCHSLSRDGAQLSFVLLDSVFTGSTALVDAEDPTARLPVQGVAGSTGAFSPDGTQFLLASAGQLQLHDAATGNKIMDIPTAGPAMYPDWSWDGSSIVFVRPSTLCVPGVVNFGQADIFVYGGAIVTMQHSAGAFSNEQVLVPASSAHNNYYPSFSPDGQWVAFARADAATPSSWDFAATACSTITSNGVSYDNPSASIWLAPTAGGGPVELRAANEGAMLTNSWPKWAPKADGEYLWLSLSSTRPYGLRLAGSAAHHQVWIAAVRRAGETMGGDPSAPAVWFPFQTMSTKNHLGQWSLKVGDWIVN